MKKLLALLILTSTACLPKEGGITLHTTTTLPPTTLPAPEVHTAITLFNCTELVPHTDNDFDGAIFEDWSNGEDLDYDHAAGEAYGVWTNDEGTILGYAYDDTDIIYADPSCI